MIQGFSLLFFNVTSPRLKNSSRPRMMCGTDELHSVLAHLCRQLDEWKNPQECLHINDVVHKYAQVLSLWWFRHHETPKKVGAYRLTDLYTHEHAHGAPRCDLFWSYLMTNLIGFLFCPSSWLISIHRFHPVPGDFRPFQGRWRGLARAGQIIVVKWS